MDFFFFIVSCAGTFIYLKRLWPRDEREENDSEPLETFPLISIIIPARNEEGNLPRLLDSLQKLSYPNKEIILIDDQSTDKTAEIARSYPIKLLTGTPLSEGWNGKNWACHQAVLQAQGEYFLFTDADTEHTENSLEKALVAYRHKKADLMSALPYHRNETWWEKMMGPFHALLLTATNAYQPRFRRLYAVGQYLFFSRSSYFEQGGHEGVKAQYPDDLALANACISTGGFFAIYTKEPLFNVRMYPGFKLFIQGWRRNFLAGMQQSDFSGTFDVIMVIIALTSAGHAPFFFWGGFTAFICGGFLLWRQHKWGNFSILGPLFPIVSLVPYGIVTLLALSDYLRGNVLKWKGRSYVGWTSKE
ncbi:MAG: glycosyltransferase [Elusimicrobiota bacterium]